MNDNIIPIIRHVPSRAVLRESFFEVNEQIAHLVARLQEAARQDGDCFFGLCDELRSQISELVDICRDCAPSELSVEKDRENETLRTLVLMVSHMELMFLYARKNRASVTHYRKEINATIQEFLRRQARISACLSR
jgi:hypothetical protein